ncbi:MAG: hypothetical protein JKX95_09140 [Bacteroidia bacterium]|nr:hypothetical protein [Bacteroidia bacterium]
MKTLRNLEKFILLCLCFMLLNSCSKDDDNSSSSSDPCANITCVNGTCVNGVCDCDEGYTGADCSEVDDPCATITCVNGTCVNGVCDCDEGYKGADCSDQITPTKIKITGVKVTAFPSTKSSGSNWDSFDGPDIYFEIYNGTTELYSSGYLEDADATQDYTFTVSSIDITDVTAEHTIYLYDYDSGLGDDYMGGYYFTPYSGSTNGFPTSVSIGSSSDVLFELTYSYVW